MSGNRLIDTNIAIAYLDGENVVVVDHILDLDDVYISVITVGELIYGASYSRLVTDNLQKIDRLLEWTILLEIERTTSEIYGSVKAELRKIGRPIPDNDFWIAAIARQHELTLASRDDHFSHVPNLQVEKW